MIKIAYLHGLDSNNWGPKNDWLKTVSKVYDPLIDYRKENIYKTIREEIIRFQPNVIVGSSMGGYFAFELSKELNIDTILFNPALHSRSVQPDISGHKLGNFKPNTRFVLGENDKVIDPIETLKIIDKEGYKNFSFFSNAHDTPIELFKTEIEKYILFWKAL